MPPRKVRNSLTLAMTSWWPEAAPAMRSLCPPMYFVAEYKTRSAPCSNGRCNTGPEVGVVDHHQDAVVFRAVLRCPFAGGADALDLHGGVGRRLEVDNARPCATGFHQGILKAVQMIQARHLPPHGRKHVVQEMLRAAVQGADVPNRPVGVRPRKQGGADGGHAAGKERGVGAVVPGGKALLGHVQGGVAEAAVDEAFGRRFCAFHAIGRLHVGGPGACVGKDKGACRVHGRFHRVACIRRVVSREHCAGLQVLLHGSK